MSFQEGLYKAEFQTQRGFGAGVVWLKDGLVRGGDSLMYYSGSYTVANGQVTADFTSKVHSKAANGLQTVLGEDTSQVRLTGAVSGNTVALSGHPASHPGLTLAVKLTLLT